jgi:UDP-N-acetylmuramate: L-alanyl-gamma-D-glutamyl-meso-diaminopimelate ligase
LHHGAVKGRVQWRLGGVHNQMNALAAVIAADHVGVPVADACRALSSF